MIKTTFFLPLLLLVLLSNCKSQKNPTGEKSVALNNQAMLLFKNNFLNEDSLNKAILLLDSAIQIEPLEIKFYFNRYSILRKLGRYNEALSNCKQILNLSKNDFVATLNMGKVYHDLMIKDSSVHYFNKALNLIDDKKSFDGAEIDRDFQRIIILGLLDDTTRFDGKKSEFLKKYKSEPKFEYYEDELVNFNREKYLIAF